MARWIWIPSLLRLASPPFPHTPTTRAPPQKPTGYTGFTVGLVNTHYVYLPIPVIIQAPRKVDPRGKMWNRLRASIGQPNFV